MLILISHITSAQITWTGRCDLSEAADYCATMISLYCHDTSGNCYGDRTSVAGDPRCVNMHLTCYGACTGSIGVYRITGGGMQKCSNGNIIQDYCSRGPETYFEGCNPNCCSVSSSIYTCNSNADCVFAFTTGSAINQGSTCNSAGPYYSVGGNTAYCKSYYKCSTCNNGGCSYSGSCKIANINNGATCNSAGPYSSVGGNTAYCKTYYICSTCNAGACASSGKCKIGNVNNGATCNSAGPYYTVGGNTAYCKRYYKCSTCTAGACSYSGKCKWANINNGATCNKAAASYCSHLGGGTYSVYLSKYSTCSAGSCAFQKYGNPANPDDSSTYCSNYCSKTWLGSSTAGNNGPCCGDDGPSDFFENAGTENSACVEGVSVAHENAYKRWAVYDGQQFYCGTSGDDVDTAHPWVTSVTPGSKVGKCLCQSDGSWYCGADVIIRGLRSGRIQIVPS